MNRFEKVTIDGVNYTIYKLDSVQAWKFFIELTKVFGSQIVEFVFNLFSKVPKTETSVNVMDVEMKEGELRNILISAFSNLSDEFTNRFISITLDKERVIPESGKYITISDHFDKYGVLHMFKVQFEVLKVNYSDFFSLLNKSK